MKYNISTLEELKAFCAQYQIDNDSPYRFLLSGDLGAGKTTFTQIFFAELFPKTIIQSPTYNLLFEYKNNHNQSLMHFDLYRLEEDEEADRFLREYTEYFSDNNIVIEWSERLSNTTLDVLENTGFIKVNIIVKGKKRVFHI
jgi:tRNA threonylcarbamoyladenosine biosynthesis protein TsaE